MAVSTTRTLGLGIIGGGGAFGRFISSALPLVPGVALRAIAGTSEQRTQRAAADLRVPFWTLDFEDLILRPEVDIVAVASPPHLHGEMAMAAVRAGKAIFVEKPVATRLVDGLALLAEARRRRVPATIDYVMRYSPMYQTVRQIARAGVLGALRRVEFRNDAGDEGLAADHWFWDRRKSGGIFIEHGVHFFDVYGWLIGAPPVAVHGLQLRRDDTDQEDVVHADVLYRNGVLGIFTHAFDKPSRLEAQEGYLVFDRGSIRIFGWTPVRLELTGLVNDRERDALVAMPGLQLELVSEISGGQMTRGRGTSYDVRYHVRGLLTPNLDSQELYRRAVGAALADLVAAIHDPQHQQRATLADGVVSLAMACVAAGTADQGDLDRALGMLQEPAVDAR